MPLAKTFDLRQSSDFHQIFQEDGKWAAIEKLLGVGERFIKMSLFSGCSLIRLHKIEHCGKNDYHLLIVKRKLSYYGRIIPLPTTDCAGKSVNGQ